MPTINKVKRYWIKQSYQSGFDRMQDNKFYHSPTWRKLRAWYIKNNPLCKQCKDKGKVVPAEIVDHIKPINKTNGWNTENGKYPNPLDKDNLQSLCKKCHYIKMAKASNK